MDSETHIVGIQIELSNLSALRLELARVAELYGGARIVDIRNRSAYRWDDQRGAQSKLVVEIVLEVRG